jgi:hypothetical protein
MPRVPVNKTATRANLCPKATGLACPESRQTSVQDRSDPGKPTRRYAVHRKSSISTNPISLSAFRTSERGSFLATETTTGFLGR